MPRQRTYCTLLYICFLKGLSRFWLRNAWPRSGAEAPQMSYDSEQFKYDQGNIQPIFLIGQIDVFVLDGYRIDGVLEWFDYRNAFEGIEFRL